MPTERVCSFVRSLRKRGFFLFLLALLPVVLVLVLVPVPVLSVLGIRGRLLQMPRLESAHRNFAESLPSFHVYIDFVRVANRSSSCAEITFNYFFVIVVVSSCSSTSWFCCCCCQEHTPCCLISPLLRPLHLPLLLLLVLRLVLEPPPSSWEDESAGGLSAVARTEWLIILARVRIMAAGVEGRKGGWAKKTYGWRWVGVKRGCARERGRQIT